jgi:hypothetical protein
VADWQRFLIKMPRIAGSLDFFPKNSQLFALRSENNQKLALQSGKFKMSELQNSDLKEHSKCPHS